jgi:hypothetical protein
MLFFARRDDQQWPGETLSSRRRSRAGFLQEEAMIGSTVVRTALLCAFLAQAQTGDQAKQPSGLSPTVVGNSVIVIATGGNQTYQLTSAADGVTFDIDGDGVADQVAWTEAGSDQAFLVIDRNGDGTINDGKELVGSATIPGAGNAFHALTKMAQQAAGGAIRAKVTAENPLFQKLLLWTDRNHNGVSEASELRPFGDLFSAIALGYGGSNSRDRHGNLFRFQGWVLLKGPKPLETFGPEDYITQKRTAYDVFFVQ